MNNVRVGITSVLGTPFWVNEWMKGKQLGENKLEETGEEDGLKKRFGIEMEEK